MSLKCVHQGCGKKFDEGSDDVCKYHPEAPIFHEGLKGWRCCKPRVLTFEEFMEIPPCTEGKHSTTDKPPELPKSTPESDAELSQKIDKLNAAAAAAEAAPARTPISVAQHTPTPPPPQPESEEDDPTLELPDGRTCRRKGCGATYSKAKGREAEESCVHHPGVPIFHEGSKGYSCCKRRVLEFDQFMTLEGCTTKNRHLFVGSGKEKNGKKAGGVGAGGEEVLDKVRSDFYQTTSTVIASFFLKKIVKDTAKVEFGGQTLTLDLVTADSPPKRYAADVALYGPISAEKSTFKILGTKLEVSLAKADGASWPVLRSDDVHTGEIFQIGRAGTMK